nr:Ldh family oxidoreductase [Phytoactinopolyspora mesophila]
MTIGTARRLATDLLQGAGFGPEEAGATAEGIVLADCWGIGSHGLMRLPYYLHRAVTGGYPPTAALRTVSDTGPAIALDGGGGLGHWQVRRAAELAATRCARFGLAAVSVGNSGHCGALGAYTLPLLEAGYVSMIFSTGPAVMPPWGGSQPLLSTSPLAAGIPSRPRPMIVDLASSAVARGKIAAHAARDEPLPAGWALDAAGRPTTDARAALHGMLAPLGGAKGYALAMLVETMSAGLAGPRLAGDVTDMFDPEDAAEPQRIGHLVVAFDPARFDVEGGAGAQSRLDELAARATVAGGRIPGGRRVMPAEIDDDAVLAVDEKTLSELLSWAQRLGVADGTLNTR